MRFSTDLTPRGHRKGVRTLFNKLFIVSKRVLTPFPVVDEPRKFGFAYGTLPDHAESGEEKFIVEWNEADDAVCYDILAFSRPNQFLARLGYPLIRRLQKRFAQDSAAAMKRGVGIVE